MCPAKVPQMHLCTFTKRSDEVEEAERGMRCRRVESIEVTDRVSLLDARSRAVVLKLLRRASWMRYQIQILSSSLVLRLLG